MTEHAQLCTCRRCRQLDEAWARARAAVFAPHENIVALACPHTRTEVMDDLGHERCLDCGCGPLLPHIPPLRLPS